jgi:dTDP-4-amino-4,6-dideoxygalactose transaminase
VEGISILDDRLETKKSYQYFVIRIDEKQFGVSRDFVHEEFKKYNVFTRKYFYPLCSDYTCYRQLPSSTSDNLPVANKVVKKVLSMPFYGGLSDDDVIKICNILKSFKK